MNLKDKNRRLMNLFYIPALLLFLFFVIYPFLRGLNISFTNWNGYSQKYKYVGMKNYIKFFKDENVWIAVRNTFIYGVGSTFLQNVLGLGFALLLNGTLKGRSLARTIIYLPVMISPLVMGYITYFFVQYSGGAINDILIALGHAPVDFLADGNRGVLIITLVNSLQFVGVSMVIYLAGLQNVPVMYYEAAQIDGANAFQQLRNITLPLLVPSINSAVVLNLIGGLKLYDVIEALTSGGPAFSTHSLSSLVSYQYFGAQRAGYSAVIGIMTFLLVMIISNVAMKYFNKKEVYM